jgi:hypothetical protein
VIASDATIEATVVRNTRPRALDGAAGEGIVVQPLCTFTQTSALCDPATRGTATVTESLIEQNYQNGLFIVGSEVDVQATVIGSTLATGDGLFGDGVSVLGIGVPAQANIAVARIDSSARAGVSSFGGLVSISDSRVQCAAFELTGELHDGQDYALDNQGNNLCGCPLADHACKLVSAGLAAPEPLK